MEVGPSYNSPNLNSCKAKYEATRVLDNLNEVRILNFDVYSVRACIFGPTVQELKE